MESNRKLWNEQQKSLRLALASPQGFVNAIELFLCQHAMVHAAAMSASGLWSFEDEVWHGVSAEMARCIPPGCEHSLAWLLWHSARIEDVTMNLLLSGSLQLAQEENWFERMKVTTHDTGNSSDAQSTAALGAEIDVEVLRAYRQAVGRRTCQVVQQLQPEDLKRKVQPDRLQQVLVQGAVLPAAREVLDYWGGLTIAGLLLMPPTRHNFIHLNEALRLRRKCT